MLCLIWRDPRLRLWHGAFLLLLLAGSIVLWGGYAQDLASWTCRYLPGCPVFASTGILCPGCGGTRAFLSCLRGDFLTALYWNPFWVLAFLMILVEYIQTWIYAIKPQHLHKQWHRFHLYAIIVFVVLTSIWVLLRNLIDVQPH